jgi:hypothetical protein
VTGSGESSNKSSMEWEEFITQAQC